MLPKAAEVEPRKQYLPTGSLQEGLCLERIRHEQPFASYLQTSAEQQPQPETQRSRVRPTAMQPGSEMRPDSVQPGSERRQARYELLQGSPQELEWPRQQPSSRPAQL